MSCSTTTRSASANLFHQVQAGDAQAIATLMDRHERLVHYIVRRQWRGSLSYAEAVHEGRIGLWRAILGYDPQRGVTFSTYASVAIARWVWRAVRQGAKDARPARSQSPAEVVLDPWDRVVAGEVQVVLQAMVARLPAKQRWVVCTYYGLDGRGGCTLAQLGVHLGCTRQAVHYHLQRALLRLRHPAFSAVLRAELVALTEISLNAAGQTPYDPVSLFLCCLLRWQKGLGWKQLYRLLAGPEGKCWRKLFGFPDGQVPAPSTMRTFYKGLGPTFHLDLCPRLIALLDAAGLLPEHSTHAGTPPERGLPDCADGMLHEAHSTMRCGQVTETCYQQTSPQQPRPCPAKEKGFKGCDCAGKACVQRCRFTTPRDPEARLIHYSGSNQEGEEDPTRARNVYGYLSYAQVLRDSWVAHTTLHPANTAERTILPNDFAHLRQRLPDLSIGELVADAAVGYKECLDVLYDAGTIPVVAIRHDPMDEDEDTCTLRGYDGHGHPWCAHGYPMSFNGIDYQRLRACWVCRQVCQRQSPPQPEDADCPFRDPNRPLGMVTHVGCAFTHPDGTRHERLARLYPYDSAMWRAHYGPRKNAVEGRNSQLAALGLKRAWSYSLYGVTADVTFADLVIDLRTLGRLVQQATLLDV